MLNTLSTFVSFIIIWWFLGFNFTWMLLYLCFVIVSLDYLYQFNTRRFYYQRQKEKEWREIIHQIIPLKILVSDFDTRTMRLNLYDCSQAAQAYIKQQQEDEDKYTKFLERIIINMETSKIQFKQFQEQESLKKYLTHRFIMIEDFIKKNEKLIMKNVSSRIRVASKDMRKQFTFQVENDDKKLNKGLTKLKTKIDARSEFDKKAKELAQIDEMEGYYYFDDADMDHVDPTKKKKIKVKVAYYSVQNSKPLLVISIEDESLREDIEFYKEEKQKSDQFITNMLENYRTTLIKNLTFFNEGKVVVSANFEEVFRNSLVLVNKSYVVYDYFLFLRIRRLYKGVSHQHQLGLIKCDPFNFSNMLNFFSQIFCNLDIICKLNPDTQIYNDEKRIKQIFISLITNCIQTSISTINIDISESYLDDINVIQVYMAFYKDEDNHMQGILDHLDGTDSPYVNQIESVVLQEIIRCVGPYDLKANTSPNGCCEIEFAIYKDLRKLKGIFNIQNDEDDNLSRSQVLNKGKSRKSMVFKEQFLRKNRKPNKTFFDLKEFNQMESIIGIPRGSKLSSNEMRNQLQAFLTLKDKRGDLIDDDEDDKDEDEEQDEENQYSYKEGKDDDIESGRKVEKLYTVEQEDEENSSGKSSQIDKSQINCSLAKNFDIDNNLTYKSEYHDEDSSKQSKTNRSKTNHNSNTLDPLKSRDLRSSSNRLGSQGISYLQQSNDNISIGSRKNQNKKNSQKEREPPPFVPKKVYSSFTSLKLKSYEDIETTDRKQFTYRQSSRIKSQLTTQQNDQLQSMRSLTQNVTYAVYTDTYRSERNHKPNQNTSQLSIDYSKLIDDRGRNNSGVNQPEIFSEQSFYDDANGCNLTFQIDKSELEINDFTPRLK